MMRRHAIGLLLVTGALLLGTDDAHACCSAQPYDLVWPADGAQDVPLDAAVSLYGMHWEGPLQNWTLELSDNTGIAVPLTTAITQMEADTFLIVATPEGGLSPDTEYHGAMFQEGGEGPPKEFSFRTGQQSSDAEPAPVPHLLYEGLGVPYEESDGDFCVSSVTAEAGALAVTICGEGLADRLLLLEVRDSSEATVFTTVLNGEIDLDRRLSLGGGLCQGHFPVDPCESYCVRVAALGPTGAAQTWSDWSCSVAVGDWECGDPYGEIAFGDDIEEGKVPPPGLLECAGSAPGTEPVSDDGPKASLGEEAANEVLANEGCTAGPPAPTGISLFLLLLVTLAALRHTVRHRSA